ncbi:Protein CBG26353 [Caenorhabditis briggsae]|uniref:Uncharacterized protein n=2 Tax=Caenorhabditis briggsae TaxID=6238 RepID=A0AAE9D610_CAEBR|nr:Protein CBG26353 [Caenorhabditis briggsae]ULT95048.1 hypothetical protein L3Y34_004055 [Caenorhabditis briggsae]CAR98954.1 Protein CBG26353 [Caenorhabditis briggsae]
MVTIVELEEENEEIETLAVKKQILLEQSGDVLEEIHKTRELMMEEFERIHIETVLSYQEKIEKEAQEYEQIYEETKLRIEEETVELQNKLCEFLEEIIEEKGKLIELTMQEKECRKITDEIFEIIQNWTDIGFIFSQILGMREAQNVVEDTCSEETDPLVVKILDKIKQRIFGKVQTILRLHQSNSEKIDGVLKRIDEFLDFVELGYNELSRSIFILVLNSMKNVPFNTLENQDLTDDNIDNVKESVNKIRDFLSYVPLCQLRPRKSLRQFLWDEIDSYQRDNDIFFDLENL